MMPRVRFVALGRVGRPHGLQGEVRLDVGAGPVRGLDGYSCIYLEQSGVRRPAEVESCRRHGRFLLVKFRGCDDPEAARALAHAVLYVDRAEMPPLEEGEYYHADVLGCVVVDGAGVELGRVTDIFPSGGHDVLVVETGGREWMVPVVASVVRDMDVEGGRIRVELPEGLPA